MKEYSILIIEDDEDIREGIRILFSGENYRITEAGSGEEGLRLFSGDIDLVILDIMMPGISGLKTCEEIRRISNVPVLFLTAKSQESDKLIGFMAGGDDYLVKPFTYSELLARTKALLRRYTVYKGKDIPEQPIIEEAGYIVRKSLKVSTNYNEVFRDSRKIELSEIEYRMLLLMIKNPGRIFSTKNLYESVWNEPYFYISNNTVMVHIRKLRMKIENDPKNPEYIHTVWGKGYRFNASDK
ncbi:Alkaline phosphatase synthesis transcriptional regulatory protein sphR [uncultured Eubacterium sp.]|uniref:response regulator transcription factor n=1 Tax=Brotomerdimonas butyrica TaxID=2981721 RepID=UPI00082175F7|nr:response regulator transcription factor [Brotomerdimonas butyrica]MCU6755715.1 response regulator transcription factor [Brotomerdimonas butyrica]SCH45497.1 Alkaline phosphatase synthesis transcriptional regulatory protein sphR [uncultured Eubacterium sp.]